MERSITPNAEVSLPAATAFRNDQSSSGSSKGLDSDEEMGIALLLRARSWSTWLVIAFHVFSKAMLCVCSKRFELSIARSASLARIYMIVLALPYSLYYVFGRALNLPTLIDIDRLQLLTRPIVCSKSHRRSSYSFSIIIFSVLFADLRLVRFPSKLRKFGAA